jgi:hypothetical protein
VADKSDMAAHDDIPSVAPRPNDRTSLEASLAEALEAVSGPAAPSVSRPAGGTRLGDARAPEPGPRVGVVPPGLRLLAPAPPAGARPPTPAPPPPGGPPSAGAPFPLRPPEPAATVARPDAAGEAVAVPLASVAAHDNRSPEPGGPAAGTEWVPTDDDIVAARRGGRRLSGRSIRPSISAGRSRAAGWLATVHLPTPRLPAAWSRAASAGPDRAGLRSVLNRRVGGRRP